MLDPESQRAERPVSASRIPGSRRLLKRMRGILIHAQRVLRGRAVTPEETKWCARVHDFNKQLVDEGDQVLPQYEDRRAKRTARKQR